MTVDDGMTIAFVVLMAICFARLKWWWSSEPPEASSPPSWWFFGYRFWRSVWGSLGSAMIVATWMGLGIVGQKLFRLLDNGAFVSLYSLVGMACIAVYLSVLFVHKPQWLIPVWAKKDRRKD